MIFLNDLGVGGTKISKWYFETWESKGLDYIVSDSRAVAGTVDSGK